MVVIPKLYLNQIKCLAEESLLGKDSVAYPGRSMGQMLPDTTLQEWHHYPLPATTARSPLLHVLEGAAPLQHSQEPSAASCAQFFQCSVESSHTAARLQWCEIIPPSIHLLAPSQALLSHYKAELLQVAHSSAPPVFGGIISCSCNLAAAWGSFRKWLQWWDGITAILSGVVP